MRMNSNALMTVVFFLAITGCQSLASADSNQTVTTNAAILQTTINGLNLESPEDDVMKNTLHGDFRFICVCGYACTTPGVARDSYPLPKKYGMRCLEGTTDALDGREHRELVGEATKYAVRYNQALLRNMKMKKP